MNRQTLVSSGTTAGGHNFRIIRDTRQPADPVYWIEYQSTVSGNYVSLGKYDTLDDAQGRISEINERQKKHNRQRNAYRDQALITLAGQITDKAITAQSILYPDDDSPEMIEAIETACHYLKQAKANIDKARRALLEQDQANYIPEATP